MKKIFIFLLLLFPQTIFTSQLIIGLHTKIIFWEYWVTNSGGLSKELLIYNALDSDINISIRVLEVFSNGTSVSTKVDSSLNMNMEPWHIEPHQHTIIEFPDISQLSLTRNILEVMLNDSISLGLMSINKSHPNQFVSKDKIITTQRINIGDDFYKCWMEQSTFFFKASHVYSIQLKIIEDVSKKAKVKKRKFIFPIEYLYPDRIRLEDFIFNFQIECETLDITEVNKTKEEDLMNNLKKYMEIEIPYSNSSNEEQIHEITIKFIVPKVEKPEVKHIGVWHGTKYGGQSISIPIICLP